jgi:RimJ/RimL family protein N-acetyltransferase
MKIDPLLIDVPEEFTTQRLLIRAPRAGDGPAIYEAIQESFDELRLWMPWAQTMPTVEESELRSRQARAKFLLREDLQLRLFLKDEGTFVGGSGLHRMDWNVPSFEIGYWVRKRFARQGYVTEAVNGIAQLAFNQLAARRVEIRCDNRNERSWRVAERCGFQLEGVLRNECRTTDGALRNTRVYARVSAAT